MQRTMAGVVTALIAVATVLQAQTTSASRWSAWLGCWRAAEADAPATCVVPSVRASAVDIVTIVNGAIESRQRVDADSQPHPVDRAGCRGMETASWSPNGRRVYRRTDLVCPGGVNGTSTTLMAISPSGEWLNIEGVRAGSGSLERLDRYHDVGLPSSVPKEIRSAIERRQLAISTARAAAAAPITEADVVEASANVEPGVVRSWLAEAGAGAAIMELAGPPRQAQQPVYEEAPAPGMQNAPTCVPSGCYAPNPYSPYNGYSMYPYSPVYASPFGFGFTTPVIIVHGRNRPPVRVGHGPIGHGPVGHGPVGHEPPRIFPLGPQAPRHEPPHGTPPFRARP